MNRKIQKHYNVCPFSLVGHWALFNRFGPISTREHAVARENGRAHRRRLLWVSIKIKCWSSNAGSARNNVGMVWVGREKPSGPNLGLFFDILHRPKNTKVQDVCPSFALLGVPCPAECTSQIRRCHIVSQVHWFFC